MLVFPIIQNKVPRIYDGKVIAVQAEVFPRFIIERSLLRGMSGGPALNENDEVVGIIAVGARDLRATEDVEDYGIIPLSYIDQLSPTNIEHMGAEAAL